MITVLLDNLTDGMTELRIERHETGDASLTIGNKTVTVTPLELLKALHVSGIIDKAEVHELVNSLEVYFTT